MQTCVLDFGNTRLKIAFFKDGEMLSVHSYDSLPHLLDQILEENKNIPTILSNVSQTDEQITKILERIPECLVLNHHTELPIQNQYKTPHTLGFDRIAAAGGAKTLFPKKPVLLLDLGTALKIDIIDPTEGFLGGTISPGLAMRFRALHTFTQKLPFLEASYFPELIGQSTEECIQSGVVNGMLHEINGMIEKYLENKPYQVIISGGDALFFESRIKTPKFTEPNLTLIGLNRILEYNVEKNNRIR